MSSSGDAGDINTNWLLIYFTILWAFYLINHRSHNVLGVLIWVGGN
jgi:hypothetical protein